VATDGFFDNLYTHDAQAQLAKFDYKALSQLVRGRRRRQEERGLLCREGAGDGGAAPLERFRVRGVQDERVTDEEIASREVECRAALRAMATMLAITAQRVSNNPLGKTPFSEGAQAAGWGAETGGKPDDITVVVALLVPDDALGVLPT
jgi:hypothetical protein